MKSLAGVGTFLVCVCLSMAPAPTSAALAENPLVLRIGIESGGDTLVEVTFENGDDESVKGGGLAHLEFGGRFNLLYDDTDFETEVTLGYKFERVSAENGDLTFRRITANLMQYVWVSPAVRIGAGLGLHLNPELDIDTPAFVLGERSIEADDAYGLMLAVDYAFSDRSNAGLRYTNIEYDFDTAQSADGSSVGVYLSVMF